MLRTSVSQRAAQDRHVLAPGVHHHLDVRVGEHARERREVGVALERIEHLGAHAALGRRDRAPPPARGRAAPGSGARTRTPCRSQSARPSAARSASSAITGADPSAVAILGRVVLSAFVAGLAAAAAAAGPAPAQTSAWETIGHSEQGRPIRALRVGSPRARVKVLVVGLIHGNEPAGRAVVARLRARAPAARHGALARGQRQPRRRGRGHALERARRGPQPQLPLPLAAPGRRVRVRARAGVRAGDAGDAALHRARAPARDRLVPPGAPHRREEHGRRRSSSASTRARSGLPRKALPRYHGTAVSWQNHTFPGDTAFVVELPGGALPRGRRRAATRTPCCRSRARSRRRARSAKPIPVRRRAPRRHGATTRSATTASTTGACATRR